MIEIPPLFTVVVPTFNRRVFIHSTIQSVLDQRFKDFELIIVDDGSTDGTREVVAQFDDRRIKYFYKENEERSIARNFGVERASGRYLNFLDSDDFLYPHHLETANKYLQQHGHPELLHLDFVVQDAKGTTVAKEKIGSVNINQKLIYANLLNGGCFFIRKDVLEHCTFIPHKDATISEDWYLWLRLAARFPVHLVDCVTNVVREHDQRSLRNINPNRAERSLLLVIAKLREDEVFLKYYKSSFPYFVSECYSLIALYYTEANKVKSVGYLLKSIYVYPAFTRRKRFWAILKNLVFSQRS